MNLSNLDKNKKYLLACSFGPDSMAAFYLLLQSGYKFEAAVVNYHLREESDLEVRGLEKYCQSHNIKLHILSVEEKITANIEKKCRDIRYRFFESLVKKYNFDEVIIAQHMDDHIETYLLQMKRKILPNHWGISEKTTIYGIDVVRPLLNYTKKELLDICVQNKVPFAIDKTNLENKYLRNRIRHEIVEKMSDEDKLKIIKEIEEKNKELALIISSIDMDKVNDVKYILSLNSLTYLYTINMYARAQDDSLSISKEQALEIRKILESEKPNVKSKIKRGLYLIKQYEKYYLLIECAEQKVSYLVIIDKPQEFECEFFYLDFRGDASNRNVKSDDYPLTIRTAQSGDRYDIKGYSCSVRRLFIDWKMPLFLRDRWPLIINKDGEIIYIPRYQKDFTKSENLNFYVKY